MKRVGLGFLVALFVAAMVIGCSQGGSSSAKKVSASDAEKGIKSIVEDLAQNGKVGSGMMPLNGYIESVRKADPAKGEALAKDLDDLRKIGANPEKVKAKAKEILAKL